MENLIALEGKVILITGGSRGLGAQMAREFANRGANLIITSRNKEKCEEVANEIQYSGNKVIALSCDVSKLNEITRLFQIILDEFGKLDVLVNNAGTNITKPALEITEREWDYINDVNLKGLFFSCQEAAKIMIPATSGKILNISSVGGVKPYKRIAPYTATKAAVIHLTKTLASEWARYNIYVNSIAPGLISTEINKAEMENEKWLEKAISDIPLRKLGTPKDISNMALYLVSDAANYITGQTFFIDGGTLSE